MVIEWSEPFKRDFKVLPTQIQGLFEDKLELLVNSHFKHPSLRVKKMQGTKDIWEGSVTMNYRFTFHKTQTGLFLRRIGTHNILKTP